MKNLAILLCCLVLFSLQHCGGSSSYRPITTEKDIAEGKYLSSFTDPALLHLESADQNAPLSTAASNLSDTASQGVDIVFYRIKEPETREFCLEGFSGSNITVSIVDSQDKVLMTLSEKDTCAGVTFTPGEYRMEYRHDASSRERAVFIAGTGAVDKAADATTIISDKNCRNCNLRNADLSYYDFTEVDFTGADFRRADLTRSILYKATIADANFSGTKLFDAMWTDGFLCNSDDVTTCIQSPYQIQIVGYPYDGKTKMRLVCFTDYVGSSGTLNVATHLNNIIDKRPLPIGLSQDPRTSLPLLLVRPPITFTRVEPVTTLRTPPGETFCPRDEDLTSSNRISMMIYEKFNCTKGDDIALRVSVPIPGPFTNVVTTREAIPLFNQFRVPAPPKKIRMDEIKCDDIRLQDLQVFE